jgi:hypothetical protein
MWRLVSAERPHDSVDTYLRFAEAVNRLDLTETEKSGTELIEDLT